MQVSCPNDIKIYNLSAGKSLPEWLSERKRRSLLKKNVDIRRRIELIQDFDMPGISTSIKVTEDKQHIFATGIYKPRVKCFDVNNLSLKFERCFDSEVVTFEILSDDYSKLVFLHCDRYIEFHSAQGKYYKLRIPRFGRDMKYHYPSCDLFIVGVSNEIYRLNLERGQFLQPFISEASTINKCAINPFHHLLVVGTQEGKVEAWDPRVRDKVATLDCGFHCISQDSQLNTVPSITALNFQGSLNLGVGTATGQILLYDIRSSKPYLTKDHMYGLPIKNIEFHENMDLVYSMDSSILKIWEKNSGKIYTSIEAQYDLNDLCVIPNTGMLMMANEHTKMQIYYIPSLGPAPYWCSFLDNLTEEMEETNYETVYDDYKFVTEKELDELGLLHLKGTNLLRAYMHGYFMDLRLYRKARDVMKPFEFERYKKKKIQEKLQENCASRVQVQKLPNVNKELALKYMSFETDDNKMKKKKKLVSNPMKDDRFKSLFTNPDFEIDKSSEQYILLNPVVSQLEKRKAKKLKVELKKQEALNEVSEEEGQKSSDESFIHDSSSDDEKTWSKDVKKQYRALKRKSRMEAEESEDDGDDSIKKPPKLYEIKDDVEFKEAKPVIKKFDKSSLGERLRKEQVNDVTTVYGSRGNREMTFNVGKRKRTYQQGNQQRREHKGFVRPAGRLGKKFKR